MMLCSSKRSIGGVAGEVFDTYMGTKQGSELSPLLFGVFMDMLHEMIKMKVEGAGPIIGNMRVPDVDYADDIALVSASNDYLQAQCLLSCLQLFCHIFGVEVHLKPDKRRVQWLSANRVFQYTGGLY